MAQQAVNQHSYRARDSPKRMFHVEQWNRKENIMAHRMTVKPKTDKKIFTNTAKKTKAVNVKPKSSRGGIRF